MLGAMEVGEIADYNGKVPKHLVSTEDTSTESLNRGKQKCFILTSGGHFFYL